MPVSLNFGVDLVDICLLFYTVTSTPKQVKLMDFEDISQLLKMICKRLYFLKYDWIMVILCQVLGMVNVIII